MSTADLLQPLVYGKTVPASPRSDADAVPADAVEGEGQVEDDALVEDVGAAKPSLRGMIFGGGVCDGSFLQLCRGGMQSTLRL